MKFSGGNLRAKIEPLDPLSGRSNYFIGSDPSKWRTNIPNYAKIALRGVYPGIDLIFYGNKQQLEYDAVVAPGADPNRIRLKFPGADRLRRDGNGNLIVSAEGTEIRQRKPVVYQMVEGQRRELDGGYVIRSHNEVAFEVARYDAAKPLVIDPTLVYSTYLGGSVYDNGSGIAVDFLGNAYVIGNTSATYPTPFGPFPTHVFVAKLSPQGDLLYSLLLSGTVGSDRGAAIAVDSAGNAYVTGTTQGGFPLVNPLQPTKAGLPLQSTGFVTKINPQGNGLVYSTYLGGSSQAFPTSIAVDASGIAVVVGFTGDGFPTFHAIQPTFSGGGDDAFVVKINPQGSGFVYSTYLGGIGIDDATGVTVDPSGNAYVTGYTNGGFPVVSALQSSYGGGLWDAFVAKLNPQGSALVYSTYLGGSGVDLGLSIAVDGNGNAYVTGNTSGAFPLAAPLQGSYGGGTSNVFVSKINAQGTALVYSTYLGVSDVGIGIAVDSVGNAFVTGNTSSSPSAGPGGSLNAFVAEIGAQGGLIYSTSLGESDGGLSIALDINDSAYVTGGTSSNTFPILHGFQPSFFGVNKAFVSVISNAPIPGPLFGSLDTPLDNTNNVTGAVPITGWALSILTVTNLEIYREAVGNEATGKFGLVFVGSAAFVPGARPDVVARYPNYPNANMAGWGYQLLTNLLPNGGNGTFRLHAFAYDSGGNIIELGAPGKTITCTNATAVKPFGAIDTPSPGGTASGNQYLNFGWALTPGASFKIPTDGSTITVMVDGAPVGHPTYNQYRSDIANAFPNYTNSQGAVGFFFVDTTRLANGMHTISWVVYDDHNRGEGIGSRYFMAQNVAENVPAEAEPFESALDGEGRAYFVEADEIDRIELHVGASGSATPLPIGSTLKNSVFYWQLGPGFLGEHQLLLTRPDGEEVPVRVLVHPKTYQDARQ